LEGASTVSISKDLGVSQGLIHYHFKNKQEIVLSVINLLSIILMERYAELSKRCHTYSDKLSVFISARLAKGNSDHDQAVAAWVIISAEAVRDPVIKERYGIAIREQLDLLDDLMSKMKQYEDSHERVYKIAALAFMEGSFSLSVRAAKVVPSGYGVMVAKDMLGITQK